MRQDRKMIFMSLILAVVFVAWSFGHAIAKKTTNDDLLKHAGKVTTAEKKAAAAKAKAKGLVPGVADVPGALDPGGIPHYFGPFANWAFSPLPKGPIKVITVTDGGTGYTAPTVTIGDAYGTGSGAGAASATVVSGVITGITGGLDGINYSAPVVTITDPTGTGATATATIGGTLSGGIKKFIDPLPNIPVAVANTTAYPGSDYYEIALVEYSTKMHSQLPPTKLRGYVQEKDGVAVGTPKYLGPLIIANRDRPVRVKFTNKLPAGTGGNLFLPVDTSVMGAGEGMGTGSAFHKQNRATIHLHGHDGIWISDGTTHQWTTPVAEGGKSTSNPYPKGVSARNVPDMGVADSVPGVLTFYYTNQQSARLMFYHDHAEGITRLNVYAGEAAGYVLSDQVEKDMINGTNVSGVNPGSLRVLPDIGIPLVIQDKTFVDAATIAAQDPTWNWGTTPGTPNTGDLWYPHVYMPAQNPWDISGMNAFGRWHYGPWFWPPVTNITTGPVNNPYFGTDLWESPMMPGTPNPSMAGEAFMDTPIVNGAAYPTLEVEPRAYRFRILNAADDRFFNLQLYIAADNQSPTTAGTTGAVLSTPGTNPRRFTEVAMIPAAGQPNQLADLPSGVPDPLTKGPDWIQIGTEGGFLPAPVVIPSQPVGWNTNWTAFNVGNVNQHSLLLGCAERADVIVDFTAYAGKTLILYNDAPAAFPAGVPVYDFFTGSPDQMDTGGAPTTQPGYGPNTRTIMQIRVTKPLTTPTPQVTLANLKAVFAKGPSPKRGVFEVSQDPILIPQAAYNSAYNVTNFPTSAAGQYVHFAESSKTFKPIDAAGVLQAATVNLPIEPKAAHDEMGGVYDTQYGRMSGMLGLDNPHPSSTAANFMAFPYSGPPTEIIKGTVSGSQIGSLSDGTQIWKITHNGVDTHPIHTHLFTTQLINRIAMDGAYLPPDLNELGWKDTFRMNPLEHIIIALRPDLPDLSNAPFVVPNSIRLMNPNMPLDAVLDPPPPAGWFDPDGNKIAEIRNRYVNFGWEYVWHCHILAHEEMDMMHAIAFAVPPVENPVLSPVTTTGNGNKMSVVLKWTDVVNATNFKVERATNNSFTTDKVTVPLGKVTTYTDPIGKPDQTVFYRVFASNTVGDTTVYPGSPGFPTETLNSGYSNTSPYPATAPPVPLPAAPSSVKATNPKNPKTSITLDWKDNANNETGYTVQRADDAAFAVNLVTTTLAANSKTFNSGTLVNKKKYYFRVQAFNSAGTSAWVNAAPFPITTK